MYLTYLRLGKRKVAGYLFTGKYRPYPSPDKDAIKRFIKRVELEEKNLFYLRHPYLTIAESFGHEDVLGKKELQKRKEYEEYIAKRTKPHRTTSDLLSQLTLDDKWD